MIQFTLDDNKLLSSIFGEQNANLKHIESRLKAQINSRGNEIFIDGKEAHIAEEVLHKLYALAKKGRPTGSIEIDDELRFLLNQNSKTAEPSAKIVIKTQKKTIEPRSPLQQEYLHTLMQRDLTFACGPAGTGKTYLAVAAAVHMFMYREVERIILSRPAVEAGEKLGFLPGDLNAKLDPYLRPLYDALFEMMPQEQINKLMENGEIEIAPLAFMRGRTLSNSFIILDEAQNTTPAQMKMFLTRLGMGSKMVVTGDISQIDLPAKQTSGLVDAVRKLDKVKDIGFINFSQKDVVRHPLAAKIVDMYEKSEIKEQIQNNEPDRDSWV